MEAYIYEPIPEGRSIRLLKLHHRKPDGPIICSLRVVSLDENPRYSAISYTWNDPNPTHAVNCDGKAINVATSAYRVLDEINQSEHRDDELWIDAISINQSDIDERNHQVRLMKSIYSESTTTFVYLGEPREPGNLAVNMIDKIIAMTKRFKPVKIEVSKLSEYDLPQIESPCWSALRDLLCQPWFRRVWVMQEYVLSREILVLYGGIWRPSNFYVSFATTLEESEPNDYGLFRMLTNLRPLSIVPEMYKTGNGSPSVDSMSGIEHTLTLLESMRRSFQRRSDWLLYRVLDTTATDPRDHIYGILGLMEEAKMIHPDLLPNYSAPVSETFIRAARYVLEEEGLPYLLEIVGFPQSIQPLPSWVPDWSKRRMRGALNLYDSGLKKHDSRQEFAAGGMIPPVYRLVGDPLPKKLVVRGRSLDTIEKLETILDYDGSLPLRQRRSGIFNNASEFFNNTSEFVMESAIPASGSARTFAHIMTLTLTPSLVNLPSSEIEAISNILEPCYDNPQLQTTAEQSAQLTAFFSKFTIDSLLGFCLTQRGDIGRVPPEAKIGDEVCFFQGISKPLIIRAHGQRPGEYLLVGECYIHGKMNGEVFQGENLDVQEITLV